MIFRKKNKFSAGLFITTSLISVVVLICFIALGRSYIDSHWDAVDVNKTSEAGKNKTQIIIRDNHHKDPFITRATPKRDKITQPIVVSDSISFGQDKASLTIVEFSDFKCDYCREQEKIIKDLVRNEYNNDVKLIWKDYPVSDKDSVSWQASKAARCANKQGKFWPYHDLLYKNSGDLSKDMFLKLAQKLSLDKDSFSQCMRKGEEVDQRIEGNIKEANFLGITGIPYLYIGDREFMGKLSREELKKIIDLELNEKQSR